MDRLEKRRVYIPHADLEAYRKGGFGRHIWIRWPAGTARYRYYSYPRGHQNFQCSGEMTEMVVSLIRSGETFRGPAPQPYGIMNPEAAS